MESFKEFRTILLGHKLKIFTDHKNLTCINFNTDRVLRWILILELYGPDIDYIPGKKNIAADTLSRLTNKVIQENTYYSTYLTEIMSEIYNIEELPEGRFPLSFKITDRYQQ